MRNKLPIAGIAVLVLVGGAVAYSVFTTKTVEEQCLDYHRKDLNDPKTAYIVGSFTTTETATKQTIVNVEIRAKNAFGAFIPGYVECVMKDGKMDETSTMIRRGRALLEKLKDRN